MVYKPTDPTPNSPENLYSAEELSEVVVGALSEPTEYDAICRAQEILEAKAHEANISLLYAPPKDAMREYHPSEALEEVQAALSFITDLTVEVQDNLMRDLLFDPEIIYSLIRTYADCKSSSSPNYVIKFAVQEFVAGITDEPLDQVGWLKKFKWDDPHGDGEVGPIAAYFLNCLKDKVHTISDDASLRLQCLKQRAMTQNSNISRLAIDDRNYQTLIETLDNVVGTYLADKQTKDYAKRAEDLLADISKSPYIEKQLSDIFSEILHARFFPRFFLYPTPLDPFRRCYQS